MRARAGKKCKDPKCYCDAFREKFPESSTCMPSRDVIPRVNFMKKVVEYSFR